MKGERQDGKVVMCPRFKDPKDQSVHVVLAFHTRKIKKGQDRRTVCARRIDEMQRMAPHSDPKKEPATTCDVCVSAMVAISDIVDGSE